MRAWRIRAYGGPEVMRLEETAVPVAGPGEVLVRTAAVSVNPVDWKMRAGLLASVVPFTFPRTLGRDGAGEVVVCGSGVDDIAAGSRVTGVADARRDGTHAEYAVLPASQIAPVPSALDAAEAASLGIAGVSALIPLAETADVRPGQRVLIHAGAGGVGGFAIQIAKLLGAAVITTCRAPNRDYCASLGADRVIDYEHEDFVAAAGPCDVVLDTVGGSVHARSYAALVPGGILVALNTGPLPAERPRTDVRFAQPQIVATRARLERLVEWSVQGRLKPQVGRRFAFDDLPAAFVSSETGRTRGKLVVTMP